MNHVLLYSILLILGLGGSQALRYVPAEPHIRLLLSFLTMFCLAFIMIHVGFDFSVKRPKLRSYAWDYVVAAAAATLPWIFCALYFVFVLYQTNTWDVWKEALLAARFASPTSAGVLFSMLAAAGLASTWVYRRARLLAIFDDLDTVLLMVPLQMLIVGFKMELIAIVAIMMAQLWLAWKYFNKFHWPATWQYVLVYSFLIAIVSKAIYLFTSHSQHFVTLHIEVLLPAFVLGVMIKQRGVGEGDLENPKKHGSEKRVATTVSAVFMLLVGLSMPTIESSVYASMPLAFIVFHVLIITIVSNVGKMFPAFCYRDQASFRERLALSVAMFPRGEVGAGVLLVSLSYGVAPGVLMIAMLSMAFNLVLTGAFISAVKWLIQFPQAQTRA